MYKAEWQKYTLNFKRPGGTSRGVLTSKDSWFIKVWQSNNPNIYGIGECGLLAGLSYDDREGYEAQLTHACNSMEMAYDSLDDWPSIQFGVEMALNDLRNGGNCIHYHTDFIHGSSPININGLVWMGTHDFMREQITEKVNAGFNCIKLKIGAINFEKEIDLIRKIRQEFGSNDIEIRVDANGAFSDFDVETKLERLSEYDIHSIEQPVSPGQWELMHYLCEKNILPIALDEELIGITEQDRKAKLLDMISPHYIILKPSLVGGFSKSQAWIKLAEERDIGWWATSALESNIGLNAIAQWTSYMKTTMPQGLGTGMLYTNNFPSPLYIENGKLNYDPEGLWQIGLFNE